MHTQLQLDCLPGFVTHFPIFISIFPALSQLQLLLPISLLQIIYIAASLGACVGTLVNSLPLTWLCVLWPFGECVINITHTPR